MLGSFRITKLCVYDRDAVVAVDTSAGKEADHFQPQKRTKLYGIATAYAQCPSGKYSSCEGETNIQTDPHVVFALEVFRWFI